MIQNFILENVHFVIGLITSFVFFAVAWLYFDARGKQKSVKHLAKVGGFLLLSVAALLEATVLEGTILPHLQFGGIIPQLVLPLKLLGYLLVIVGLITDKLQARPTYTTKQPSTAFLMATSGFTLLCSNTLLFFSPILVTMIAYLYLRHATKGLENHLKPVALAFFILAFAEMLSLNVVFRQTTNPLLAAFVAPYSWLWITQQGVQLLGILILGRWVFQYLFQRIQTQLFMFFVLAIMGAFLVTTISFTTLLLKNLQQSALEHLRTDAQVLQYAITAKKEQTKSDAQVFAQNPEVLTAIEKKDTSALKTMASAFLINKDQSFLTVVSKDGVVLMRGEDPDRIGDSLSSDPLVSRVIQGEMLSTVTKKQGVLAPEISIRSASPIATGSGIVGAVVVGSRVDNAFVDGIKETTGLDVSVYADTTRSATTFVSADGKSRWIGVKETSPEITKTVLKEAKPYIGTREILNTSYLTVFAPLLDVDNVAVGMVFVGKEEIAILQSAALTIQTTFVIAAILLVLSLIPAYLISRYISYQIR